MTTVDNRTEAPLAWQDVVLSFAPPARRTPAARRRLAAARLPVLLLIQAALTWRLSNVPFQDEALYISVGEAVLHRAVHGSVGAYGAFLGPYGAYLSGAPDGYPVVAGALFELGGLELVRLFSLVCMLGVTVCAYRIGRALTGEGAGLLAATAFASSGAVLFVGKLATYDAVCILLIAIAAERVTTRRGPWSALAAGGCLAAAATAKYAGAIFIPFVVLLPLLVDTRPWRGLARSAMTAVVVGALIGSALLLWGSGVDKGIAFTTTHRTVEDYATYGVLLHHAVRDLGLLGAAAAGGLVLAIVRRRWRLVLVFVLLGGAGAALPFAQIRVHELTSLDKQTAYAALFLCLPAGYFLAQLFRRRIFGKAAAAAVVWVLAVSALALSASLFAGWPSSVDAPTRYVAAHDVRGLYVSTDGDAQELTSHVRGVTWLPSDVAFGLFASGRHPPRGTDRYAGFVYRSGEYPALQQAMVRFLRSDRHYRLVATLTGGPGWGDWYVWQRVARSSR